MIYTSSNVGMVGCCDPLLDKQNCGWVTSCVDYSEYQSDCGSNCMVNSFIRKCSNALSPYCVSWTYPGAGAKDYGCASTSDSFFQTVLQSATDTFFSSESSISLTTLSGSAVTGWDEEDGGGGSTYPTSNPSNGSSSRKKKKGVKLGLGAIIGIVVVGLFILFVIVAGIIFCMMKKKKARQLAANQQIMETQQQTRPQSQYAFAPPNPQLQQQVPPPPMPTVPPTPQPGLANDYFGKGGAGSPQVVQVADPHKVPMTPAQEYMQSPISNPPTPAPAYVAPYYANAAQLPPMPSQSPGPMNGAVELQTYAGRREDVHEIGSGR